LLSPPRRDREAYGPIPADRLAAHAPDQLRDSRSILGRPPSPGPTVAHRESSGLYSANWNVHKSSRLTDVDLTAKGLLGDHLGPRFLGYVGRGIGRLVPHPLALNRCIDADNGVAELVEELVEPQHFFARCVGLPFFRIASSLSMNEGNQFSCRLITPLRREAISSVHPSFAAKAPTQMDQILS